MLLSCHPILSTHSLKQLHRVKKALEVKTPVVFSLVFANNPILSCFFFSVFLNYTFQLLQLLHKLVIPMGIPIKDGATEIEI